MAAYAPWLVAMVAGWTITGGTLAVLRLFLDRQGRLARRHLAEPFGLAPPPGLAGIPPEEFDVETALYGAVRQLDDSLARSMTSVRIAVREDLMIRADRRTLHVALRDVLRAGAAFSPGGSLQIAARPYAGQVEITVIAASPATDGAELRVMLGAADRLVAQLGGELAVANGEADIVFRLRLPAAPVPALARQVADQFSVSSSR
jgi:hypothetical protein